MTNIEKIFFFVLLKDKALTEEEKKSRKKAERERKRQEARENAEKKKRFGLTPEKKRKLKLLIMQKATEDLKNEAQRKMQAKKNYLDQKVQPLPELQHLNEGKLNKHVNKLRRQVA
jgi:hypothetical protein